MDERFSISLDVENIGPHYESNKLCFSEEVDSNKSVFYAANGMGKSFISRAFRLNTPSKVGVVSDEVLTIGKQSGHFSFGIHSKNVNKELDISIKRGEIPMIKDSSGLLFHVFNSDYVEQNIKQKHYSLDGEIEGYILGKVQIDLSEEKKKTELLKKEVDEDSKTINEKIESAKAFLKQNGITTNTAEYQVISRDNVQKGFNYSLDDSVEECIRKIRMLEDIPEDIQDIQFSLNSVDTSYLDELEKTLLTAFPKSEWDEQFVKEYKNHIDFIEAGLDCDNSDTVCPFCKRKYDSNALNLINSYNKYREDQETKIIGMLKNALKTIEQYIDRLNDEEEKIQTAELQLINIQQYFPSLNQLRFETITKKEEYKSTFESLCNIVTKKIDNLNQQPKDANGIIANCKQSWLEITEIQNRNRATAETINKTKNDVRAERLTLRKNLCKAKSIALHIELKEAFNSLNQKTSILKNLEEEITKKEQLSKVKKKDKVYEAFMSFLNRFFSSKYQIDKDTFQIKFLGNVVGKNASSILSDGEKSIVAFCWYLAETYTIINSEDDYNKLFFIIDDPISSMDFNYVYAVAQIIKDIKSIYSLTSHERIWIFTHNIEFFSILMRNHIMSNAFILKPGLIQKFNHKLLLPYENHLYDLVEIAEGNKAPDHTTGNSIRHVIETIAKFEDPEIGLEKYVNDESILSEDSCIYSLCQDLSHGNIRMESPYSEDLLRGAAKTVIRFVDHYYPNQIKNVKEKRNIT